LKTICGCAELVQTTMFVLSSHYNVIFNECWTKTFEYIKQSFSRLFKLKETFPILKAL